MMTRVWKIVIDNSLLLLVGAISALLWANLHHTSYEHFSHALHFVVNDVGMVFFFALATKEIFEATLPGGALASPREAAVPLLAAVGGMAAPAALYVIQVTLEGRPELIRGPPSPHRFSRPWSTPSKSSSLPTMKSTRSSRVWGFR